VYTNNPIGREVKEIRLFDRTHEEINKASNIQKLFRIKLNSVIYSRTNIGNQVNTSV